MGSAEAAGPLKVSEGLSKCQSRRTLSSVVTALDPTTRTDRETTHAVTDDGDKNV